MSPALGKLYDRIGLPVILGAILLTAAFSPFVFLLSVGFALVGMALWGIGQVTQDMLFSAVVAGVLPEGRKNLAFGLYYSGYGLGWLAGATTTCLFYQQSLLALVIFAAAAQLISVPLFLLARRARQWGRRSQLVGAGFSIERDCANQPSASRGASPSP